MCIEKNLPKAKPFCVDIIPLQEPSSSSDLALSKIASRSKLTECIDMEVGGGRVTALEERGGLLQGRVLSTMALVILGVRSLMSIPLKT